MQLQLTEKDKKLLLFLAMFVVIVGIGYWGVFPNIKSMMQTSEEMVDAEAKKDIIDMKLIELSMLQIDNEELEEEIVSAKKEYFPMMTSSQIDFYFTDMGLSYGLNRYDLIINMPQEQAKLEPYQYSTKALNPYDYESDVEDLTGTSEKDQLAALDKEAGIASDDELFGDDEEMEVDTGIYAATVTMKLGGKNEDLKRLVDDLSKTSKKIQVEKYGYSYDRGVQFGEDGSYDVVQSAVLEMTVKIYMCEEEKHGNDE